MKSERAPQDRLMDPIPSRVSPTPSLLWRVAHTPYSMMPRTTSTKTRPLPVARAQGPDPRDPAAAGLPEVLAALKNGHSATIDGAWGSAGPLAAAAPGAARAADARDRPAHVGDVDDSATTWRRSPASCPRSSPPGTASPREARAGDEVFGRRLRVSSGWRGPRLPGSSSRPCRPCCSRCRRRGARAVVAHRPGRRVVAVEELTAWLVERGMARVEVVEVAGEFSLRGGILDVFPPDAAEPVRIEFFGDEVESIRPFDPETQRSLDRWDVGHAHRQPAARCRRSRQPGPCRPIFPRRDLGRPGRAQRPPRGRPQLLQPDRRPPRPVHASRARWPGWSSVPRSPSRPSPPARSRRPATCGSRASSGSRAS